MPLTYLIEEKIPVPEGINVTIKPGEIHVKGPRGKLFREYDERKISVKKINNEVVLRVIFPGKRRKAYLYTIKSHINNMFTGVTKGFRYRLRVVQTHFPIEVAVEGRKVLIKNFIGEKKPREAEIVGDVKVTVNGKDVVVEGINKEDVGQTAANIQLATKIKDKDVRKFIDGVYVYKKEVIK